MLRPSYNEQIQGFGFSRRTLGIARSTTKPVFDNSLTVVSETTTNLGATIMNGDSNAFSVLQDDQGGIDIHCPFSADTRECYSYAMSGMFNQPALSYFAFMGLQEVAHTQDGASAVEIFAMLPAKIMLQTNIVQVSAEGFVRPNVNPSTYANIGNVTGIIFGIGMMQEGSGTLACKYLASFEVQRWNDPDINVRTPVV